MEFLHTSLPSTDYNPSDLPQLVQNTTHDIDRIRREGSTRAPTPGTAREPPTTSHIYACSIPHSSNDMSSTMAPLRTPWNTQYLPPILQLHAEIGGLFADHMDMMSLVKWRMTCKTNYLQGSASLQRSLVSLLRHFIPFPHTLVDTIGAFHALIGGEVALCFILRDPDFKPHSLEIFSSEYEFHKLCTAILNDPHIHNVVVSHDYETKSLFSCLRRLIGETLTIHLENGRVMYIHRSFTTSAAAPLTRAPCTALSNFVTPFSFGCSHPILTLNRRALLADEELRFLSENDAVTMNNLLKHKFAMAVSPAAWPEYHRIGPPQTTPGVPTLPSTTTPPFTTAPTPLTIADGVTFSVTKAAEHPSYDDPIPEGLEEFSVEILGHDGIHFSDSSDTHQSPHYNDTHNSHISFPNDVVNNTLKQPPSLPSSTTVTTTHRPPPAQHEPHVDHAHVALLLADTIPPTSPHVHQQHQHVQPISASDKNRVPRFPSPISNYAHNTYADNMHEATIDLELSHAVDDNSLGKGLERVLEFESNSSQADEPNDLTYVLRKDTSHSTEPTEPLPSINPPENHVFRTTSLLTTSHHSAFGVDDVETVDPFLLQIHPHDAHTPLYDDNTPSPDGYDTDVDSTVAETFASDVQAYLYRNIPLECWRHLFICPSQGRYFGDQGSFVDYFDPLRGDESKCVDDNIAPYGPMVVWRVMSTFDCEEGCEYFDDVLEEGVTSIPVMFKKDPYGELRDVVSDRCMSYYGRHSASRKRRSHSI